LDPQDRKPAFIAGVPPDYFSATGQRWGNPIYDWKHLEDTDFAFIEDRIRINAKVYDIIRLDHFRAFDTYWKIPSSCPTAIDGKWIEAPGYAFFDSLFKKQKLAIIAEDLGDLRPEVLVLRDHYDFPGMNVVEFTFHDAEISGDEKKHALWNSLNSVCYLGTHDNDTILGYYNDLPEEEKELWDKAIAKLQLKGETIPEKMIRYCLSKDCAYAVIALQDLLGLDGKARINVPGIIDDVNWTWRLVSFKPLEEKIVRLGELNKEYHRR
jgi:4-alpha-glucanotransferase